MLPRRSLEIERKLLAACTHQVNTAPVVSSKRFLSARDRIFLLFECDPNLISWREQGGVDRCQQSLLGNVRNAGNRFDSFAAPGAKSAIAAAGAEVQRAVCAISCYPDAQVGLR